MIMLWPVAEEVEEVTVVWGILGPEEPPIFKLSMTTSIDNKIRL
jgi:hypothetical protein